MLCPTCGTRLVKRRRSGRTVAYKVFRALALPPVLTERCALCGYEVVPGLDPGELSAVARQQLRELARSAIWRLRAHASERGLERELGLAQGYLCRLGGGNSTPSAPLVLLLSILADNPQLLSPLRSFWSPGGSMSNYSQTEEVPDGARQSPLPIGARSRRADSARASSKPRASRCSATRLRAAPSPREGHDDRTAVERPEVPARCQPYPKAR